MTRRTFIATAIGAALTPGIMQWSGRRRVAVLKHSNGTRTCKNCRDQEEAIEFLQANRTSTDVLEIHNF